MKPNIALATYAFRHELKEDLPRALKKIKEMGFNGVELCGGFYYEAETLRKALVAEHLELVGWHIGLPQLDDECFYATIKYMQAVGNQNLVVAWLPEERTNSVQAWQESAILFNRFAEKLRPYGMRIGYHNHDKEFVREDGMYWIEHFCKRIGSGVFFQLDTGNMASAACDPVTLMRRNPGIFHTVHFKPFSYDTGFNALIGQDSVDHVSITKMCKDMGTEWILVEFEHEESYTKEEGAKACLDWIGDCLSNI